MAKRGLVIQDNIVRDQDGLVQKIICWACSAVVAHWVDDDVVESQGAVKVVVRQKFRNLANYAKAVFVLDNGALFTPIFCATCAKMATAEHCDQILKHEAANLARDNKAPGEVAFMLARKCSKVEAPIDRAGNNLKR